MNYFACGRLGTAIPFCAILAWMGMHVSAGAPMSRETAFNAPRHQMISVKMIGPADESADLQIICILNHDPAGDQYIEAMEGLNKKLNGLLSHLRDDGEFAGDAGETLLITPPPGSIAAKQLLLIGVGPEKDLSLETMKLVGRIAAREAMRLRAAHVGFAPTLRDQGSQRIEVADGDAAMVEQWVLACDTEKKLQAAKLAPAMDVETFRIEAGPKYFDAVSKSVEASIGEASRQLDQRSKERPTGAR